MRGLAHGHPGPLNPICDGVDLYTSNTRANTKELCEDLLKDTLDPNVTEHILTRKDTIQ